MNEQLHRFFCRPITNWSIFSALCLCTVPRSFPSETTYLSVTFPLECQYFMPPLSIGGGGMLFSGCQSVNSYFAGRDISVLSGAISMKLARNIYRASGNFLDIFKVRGQRSRS